MSDILDLRKYNIKTEDDALQFVGLMISKLPQIEKVLKANRMKLASAESRANFAEGKESELDQGAAVQDEHSIGERITGQVVPKVSNVAQNRVAQLKAAAAQPAHRLDKKIAPVADGEPTIVTEDEDEGLNLPDSSAPAGPGQIGRLDLGVQQPPVVPLPPANEIAMSGPVDLAAMAAAQGQSEEEIAAAAGTSPSEHAADDGVLPASTYEIKESDLIWTQFFIGEDTYTHVKTEDGAVDHYLKNSEHISVPEFEEAEKASGISTDILSPDDTTGVGDRAARAQNNTQA